MFFSFFGLTLRVETDVGFTTPIISETTEPGKICQDESTTLSTTNDEDDVNWYDNPISIDVSSLPREYTL